MDTPRAFKKRRLDDALHKPFKSPLRKPLKQTAGPANASNLSSTSLTLSKSPSEASKLSVNASTYSKSPHELPNSLDHATARAKAHDSDPTTAASIRTIIVQNKALERQTIQLRQDTDSLTQALSILRANKAEELEELAQKWRDAARLAAEEIFASARDRVNTMGGVGAWRKQEQERSRRQREYFEPKMGDGGGDGEDVDGEDTENWKKRDGKCEERWEYDFRDVEGVEGERTVQDEEEEKYQDDETFTMDMMLKSLGIDLTLIGYSKKRQTWIG